MSGDTKYYTITWSEPQDALREVTGVLDHHELQSLLVDDEDPRDLAFQCARLSDYSGPLGMADLLIVNGRRRVLPEHEESGSLPRGTSRPRRKLPDGTIGFDARLEFRGWMGHYELELRAPFDPKLLVAHVEGEMVHAYSYDGEALDCGDDDEEGCEESFDAAFWIMIGGSRVTLDIDELRRRMARADVDTDDASAVHRWVAANPRPPGSP